MSVALLVPTYQRSKTLEATTKHLIESCGFPSTIYYIVDENDQLSIDVVTKIMKDNSCVKLLKTIERGVGRCFEFGYHATTEDFVVTVGDDMLFPDGWLQIAMNEIKDKGVFAIADENSGSWCVFLVRRSYVQEKSCVVNRPNAMFNVDYDRIADSEMVFTLQERGDIAYATFFVDHRNPLFYGSKKLSADGKSYEVHHRQVLIREHSIPYSDIVTEIVRSEDTGVANILRIKFFPKDPICVDEFRYTPYTTSANKKDEELLKSRAHLWGGNLYHKITPKVFKRIFHVEDNIV